MPRHRDSHTVPRFYLRGFAHEGHLISILDGRARPVGVGVATVERDAYALLDKNGALHQGFEDTHFAGVESRAAGSHRRLVRGQLPRGEDWLNYLTYLALGMLRTRRAMALSAGAMPAELSAFAPPGSHEHRRLYMQSLLSRLWPRHVWLLGQLDYRLIEVPYDLPLITADHPVGLWTDQADGIDQIGLLGARLLVHPVDRHHALWFKKPWDSWPEWLDDPWRVAANSNWAMAQVATRELFVHPNDAGRVLLWLPNGRGQTRLGAVVPVVRALPLWLPAEGPEPVPTPEQVESALAQSHQSQLLALIALEMSLDQDRMLAVDRSRETGDFAALIRSDRGISTLTGNISLGAAG